MQPSQWVHSLWGAGNRKESRAGDAAFKSSIPPGAPSEGPLWGRMSEGFPSRRRPWGHHYGVHLDGGFHEGESLGGLVLGLITRYHLWAGFHDREFHGGIHPLRARPVPVVTWKHPWHEGTPLGHLVNTLEKRKRSGGTIPLERSPWSIGNRPIILWLLMHPSCRWYPWVPMVITFRKKKRSGKVSGIHPDGHP